MMMMVVVVVVVVSTRSNRRTAAKPRSVYVYKTRRIKFSVLSVCLHMYYTALYLDRVTASTTHRRISTWQCSHSTWHHNTDLTCRTRNSAIANALSIILTVEYDRENSFSHHTTSDHCNWLCTLYMLYFWDADNETFYSTWNYLQRALKETGYGTVQQAT